MNILVLGGGGREHAIAQKLAESAQCDQLFVAPGNAGTAQIAQNLNLNPTDFDAVAKTVKDKQIKILVVGPEAPLVAGIKDFFDKNEDFNNLMIIGPSLKGAELEGSKERAKIFMESHNIPTAAYQSFTADNLDDGKLFLDTLKPPYVLKADGLAGGKGVLILKDLDEAKIELTNMLTENKFGAASQRVVIEEFLDGIELSVFVLTDGKNYLTLPNAKDYKRIGEGDTGLNTGGMGAISPVPFADEKFMQKVETKIIQPTIKGLQKENIDYKGFVFIGLMKVGDEPFVVEYNVRMGDPETEVVMPRIESDLVELFKLTAQQQLDKAELKISSQSAATVMLVSGGYPEKYQKGKVIQGLTNVDTNEVTLFHAGTQLENNQVLTNGGRVIAVTALADNYKKALEKSYTQIKNLCFEDLYFRKDIGFDLN
ncbi:phosphoribosylamine--glycine ligase [Flavobacteriaceae bacterium 14752]|uniref:phosphoribosylamine--glycine ligase n=1 Tax=Mesohalobacter salilacus TaxID=2491711 RepID=UPI000F63C68D|nr:phosphoribosylamine--glycine ligase [Flavobacteriaceae bacterium 14752]